MCRGSGTNICSVAARRARTSRAFATFGATSTLASFAAMGRRPAGAGRAGGRGERGRGEVGVERPQRSGRGGESVDYRRRLHGQLVVRQPVHDLHGAHRPRLRPRGARTEPTQSVMPPSTTPKKSISTASHVDSVALHEDRYFDPTPAVLNVARVLYEEIRTLPLICPHGHIDPRLLAENCAFPDPTSLIIIPAHYILPMMNSRGVPLESLGIASRDGTPVERDPRKIWQLFARHYYLFRATPTGAWLDPELHEVFRIPPRLTPDNGLPAYDEISES